MAKYAYGQQPSDLGEKDLSPEELALARTLASLAFRRQTGLTPSGWREKSCSSRS